MAELNDYGPFAHLYDIYVNVDIDVKFFVDLAAENTGPVLELMAGTGRVSKHITQKNSDLTCVDASKQMLEVLMKKSVGATHAPNAVCADVRALPLGCRFELALIPFNSFSELTSRHDQEQALAEVNRVLVQRGRLVCTLHNPSVRKETLDHQNRLMGTFDLVAGSKLEFWAQGGLDSDTGLAYSRQTYRLLDGEGRQVDREIQEVRFALIDRVEFESMAKDAGFGVVSLVGDYEGSEFREDSPFMIWNLEKLPRSDL